MCSAEPWSEVPVTDSHTCWGSSTPRVGGSSRTNRDRASARFPTLRGVATKRLYTYPQVADRIEEELGVRPSLSSLRAEAAESRRRARRGGLPRLTMGLPDPEPRASTTAVVHFSRTTIETWLRRHPRRRYEAARQAVTTAASGPKRQLEVAVRRARRAGVSWTHITEALSAGSSSPANRSWTHRRFSYLDED